jgi:flagellar hook-length control protein FliK
MKHYRQHEKTEDFIDDFAVPHLDAMTKEELHRKAEISEELGYRDMQISQLREQLAQAQAELVTAKYDGICEAARHVSDSYTQDNSDWVIGANAIIVRFAKYAIKLTDSNKDKGEL